MSEIALYNILRRIPETTDAEIKEAVADVASSKEVATKSDIAEVKIEIAKLETKTEATHRNTIMWVVGVGLSVLFGNAMIVMTLLRLLS